MTAAAIDDCLGAFRPSEPSSTFDGDFSALLPSFGSSPAAKAASAASSAAATSAASHPEALARNCVSSHSAVTTADTVSSLAFAGAGTSQAPAIPASRQEVARGPIASRNVQTSSALPPASHPGAPAPNPPAAFPVSSGAANNGATGAAIGIPANGFVPFPSRWRLKRGPPSRHRRLRQPPLRPHLPSWQSPRPRPRSTMSFRRRRQRRRWLPRTHPLLLRRCSRLLTDSPEI